MSVVSGLLAGGLAAGVLTLLASPLLYRGLQHRTRYHRFRELPITTPATAQPDQTVLITGSACAQEDRAVEAPVSGDSALFAAWDIHSLRRYHPLGVRYVWAPEALGIETHGFEIHERGHQLSVPDWSRQDRLEGRERLNLSGTGQLPVEGLDVKGLWIELDEFDTEKRVLPSEAVPERLRTLARRVGFPAERPTRLLPTLPWLRTPEATLQFREITLLDGQDVTILGAVAEPPTPDDPGQLREPAEFPPLVSPLSPETLLQRYKWSYWKSVYGLGFVVLSLASVIGIGVAL